MKGCHSSREENNSWSLRIRAAWQQSVTGILEAGRLLIEAKVALPHGAFTKMLETELPFSDRTAQMLMAVAHDKRISKATHVSGLPASWSTLYEITKLSDKTFLLAEEQGIIRPDVERKELIAFRREHQPPKQSANHSVREDNFQRDLDRVAESVGALLDDCPKDKLDLFIVKKQELARIDCLG